MKKHLRVIFIYIWIKLCSRILWLYYSYQLMGVKDTLFWKYLRLLSAFDGSETNFWIPTGGWNLVNGWIAKTRSLSLGSLAIWKVEDMEILRFNTGRRRVEGKDRGGYGQSAPEEAELWLSLPIDLV